MANSNKKNVTRAEATAAEKRNAQKRAEVNVKTGKYALIRVRKPIYKALLKRKRDKKLRSLGAAVADLAGIELDE